MPYTAEEYRVVARLDYDEGVRQLELLSGANVSMTPDQRFLCSIAASLLAEHAPKKKRKLLRRH